MDRASKTEKLDIMRLQSLELGKLLECNGEERQGHHLAHGAEDQSPWKIMVFDSFT